jgi:SAM-dependent methyltransferase
MKSVLNIGGGSKSIPIPTHFAGWRHDLLDLDPNGKPDIVEDARELEKLNLPSYDAVYCSHNLEHYHRHDGAKVARGVHHLLKPEGFFEIHVPDVLAVMRHVIQYNLAIDDLLYHSPAGPILVRDVLYGYHVQIEQLKNELYAHKTGFSPASLARFVTACGFPWHAVVSREFEIVGYFFKQQPAAELLRLLGIASRS